MTRLPDFTNKWRVRYNHHKFYIAIYLMTLFLVFLFRSMILPCQHCAWPWRETQRSKPSTWHPIGRYRTHLQPAAYSRLYHTSQHLVEWPQRSPTGLNPTLWSVIILWSSKYRIKHRTATPRAMPSGRGSRTGIFFFCRYLCTVSLQIFHCATPWDIVGNPPKYILCRLCAQSPLL